MGYRAPRQWQKLDVKYWHYTESDQAWELTLKKLIRLEKETIHKIINYTFFTEVPY